MFDFTKNKKETSREKTRSSEYTDILRNRKKICAYFDKQKTKLVSDGYKYEYGVVELTEDEEVVLKKPKSLNMDLLREVDAVWDRCIVGQAEKDGHLIIDVYDGREPKAIIHMDDDEEEIIPISDLERDGSLRYHPKAPYEMSVDEIMASADEVIAAEKRAVEERYRSMAPQIEVIATLDPMTIPGEDLDLG